MTVHAMQYAHQTVPPSIIYADVEKTIFEAVIKKWSHHITPAKTQRRKKWLTQKEAADTYGLRYQNIGAAQKTGQRIPYQRNQGRCLLQPPGH